MYTFGQQVDVYMIWAGCQRGYGEPLADWFAGYRFCCYDKGDTVLLFHRSVDGKWAKVRYPLEQIRPSKKNAIKILVG